MSGMGMDDAERQVNVLHRTMGEQNAQQQKRLPIPPAWKRLQQSLQPPSIVKIALVLLVVVAARGLVHVSSAHGDDAYLGPKIPPHVLDLRDVILTAAHSGNIEELKSAFDVSGSVPDLGISPRSDPIKALKDRSADPNGRDTLAALVQALEMPPAALPLGNDIENNLIYVWPGLSTRPLDKLTPSEQVDLYRLVSPELAADMRAKKRWLWWRVIIGADGTWTLFRKSN
ncbi:hypothetical protein [Hyphomicrobium sp.]|uniref:hypothetical protein n=1 Tax=Hyphomicrobium sp. TaxID=82 RepID=UPI0025BE8B16|nr:hypothetical protein [Hyphomicrobium sp.]